jgi:hypothetical protein
MCGIDRLLLVDGVVRSRIDTPLIRTVHLDV